jgi:hypothetical protein
MRVTGKGNPTVAGPTARAALIVYDVAQEETGNPVSDPLERATCGLNVLLMSDE